MALGNPRCPEVDLDAGYFASERSATDSFSCVDDQDRNAHIHEG
ncbi:Uncharacterised protein [Mycobacteroides abscessus subsp. abscessus]|nr:Uncharacterised protein [Mycobacteroides abscessus subsp. abscessus]